MLLDGIGISGYRSFGEKLQLIGPFSKLNIFIGQNNSGKSNILAFLQKCNRPMTRATRDDDPPPQLAQLDRHRPIAASTPTYAVGITLCGETYEGIMAEAAVAPDGATKVELLKKMWKSRTLVRGRHPRGHFLRSKCNPDI